MTINWNGEPSNLYWGGDVEDVYLGSELVWTKERTSYQVLSATGSRTITAPNWARYVRVVALGGGGGSGGGNGGNFASGEGGGRGQWNSGTIVLTSSNRTLSATVGSGGTGGSRIGVNGTNGGSSSVSYGSIMIVGTGGRYGRGGAPGVGVDGESPSTYWPWANSNIGSFTGGNGGTLDRPGGIPGAGGGGGGGGIFNGGSGGQPGGRGQVWLYYYSRDPANNF